MKRLAAILLLICACCSSFGALAIRWNCDTNITVTKTLLTTYSAYSNIPPAYLQLTNNYLVVTNIVYTNGVAQTNSGTMIPALADAPEIPVATNYQVFAQYRSKPISFTITQGTNASGILTNWSAPVSSNVFVIKKIFPGTNYFTILAIHTNLTDNVMVTSTPSAMVYYPTPIDQLILSRVSNSPPIIAIGFTPRTNRFYTLQGTKDFKAWTNKFPMEKITNANPYYYKELPASNQYEFFRAINSITNIP
jgi:hypothetical protein